MSDVPEDQNIEESAVNDSISISQEETENVEEQKEKLLRLPLARVKNIAKNDPEVQMINQDASFLIAKSTELFIESLVREAHKYTVIAKKKTVQKNDIDSAIEQVDALMFLVGMLN